MYPLRHLGRNEALSGFNVRRHLANLDEQTVVRGDAIFEVPPQLTGIKSVLLFKLRGRSLEASAERLSLGRIDENIEPLESIERCFSRLAPREEHLESARRPPRLLDETFNRGAQQLGVIPERRHCLVGDFINSKCSEKSRLQLGTLIRIEAEPHALSHREL